MAATIDEFKQAMSRFGTGVTVLTFLEADGTVHGITANSVASLSLRPLLVLACIDHRARSYGHLKHAGKFVMNILSIEQSEASTYFAKNDTVGDPPFPHHRSGLGNPVLDGALAYLDCKVVEQHPAGDHTIFIGEVVEIGFTDREPLMYYKGKYRRLAPGE